MTEPTLLRVLDAERARKLVSIVHHAEVPRTAARRMREGLEQQHSQSPEDICPACGRARPTGACTEEFVEVCRNRALAEEGAKAPLQFAPVRPQNSLAGLKAAVPLVVLSWGGLFLLHRYAWPYVEQAWRTLVHFVSAGL